MTAPDIALQSALHDRLISTPELTALVDPDLIRDGSARPERFPAVLFANVQTVLAGVSGRVRHTRVFLDLHVWTREDEGRSTSENNAVFSAREIANEVRNALLTTPIVPGFAVNDNFQVTGARTLRDPKNFGHVVVSVEALLAELI